MNTTEINLLRITANRLIEHLQKNTSIASVQEMGCDVWDEDNHQQYQVQVTVTRRKEFFIEPMVMLVIDQDADTTTEEREYTGVLTRDNQKIYVGDIVDTVQGTRFEVIKLEHSDGIKYALFANNRPYDLEPWMSPNLWLVNK